MINFTFASTTKVIFGKETEYAAGPEIQQLGARKVLLLYGGNSAQKNGLLDRVKQSLNEVGLSHTAFGGVMPNPLLSYVQEATAFAKKENVDFILAIGGGSVIDAAKSIAMSIPSETPVWDFFDKTSTAKTVIPIGAVITLAASGSETSNVVVLTKDDGLIKKSCRSELIRPIFAIMNPELTYSLPPYQTASGIVDIMMHTLDRYLSPEEYCDMTDGISEALLRTAIKNGRRVMENPQDYDARAELMWAGSLSQNDLTGLGKRVDFAPHQLEHELSGEYDVAHGAGLSAIWSSWARYVCPHAISRFIRYGINVWGLSYDDIHPENTAIAAIDTTEQFFQSIGMPISIPQILGRTISPEEIETLAEKCTYFGERSIGTLVSLDKQDIIKIYQLANEE